MRFTPSDKPSHTIVPEKLRCVWMTAGILTYQLCDRQFDCENCPLDKAMRMNFSPKSRRGTPTPRLKDDAPNKEYLFSRNHCWVRKVENTILRVGLEPQFASALISLKAIALPAIGENVEPSQFCCWIILEGGTIPIRSPIHGKIIMTNARIANEPHEVRQHPLTNGWLFSIQVNNGFSETDVLMTKEEADQSYVEDFSRFTTALNEALYEKKIHVGMTLQDGGMFLQNVPEMVGVKKYCELLRTTFVVP
jgi:glycine cleavage system H protein